MDTAAALKETRLQRESVLKLVTEARLERLEAELKSTKRSQSKKKIHNQKDFFAATTITKK